MRKPLRRRKSEMNLLDLSQDSTFLSSTLSENLELSTRSIPATLEKDFEVAEIQELKNVIETLRNENSSAHEEIINLHFGCTNLRKEITEKNKEIQFLKNISSNSMPSTPNITPNRKLHTPTLKKLTNIRSKISRLSPITNSRNICHNETPKHHHQPLLNDVITKPQKLSMVPTFPVGLPSLAYRRTVEYIYQQEQN